MTMYGCSCQNCDETIELQLTFDKEQFTWHERPLINDMLDAKYCQRITWAFDAKWSQDLLMPNVHRTFWCQMITRPFDAKWSQDLLMPNDHRIFWCQMITGPFDAKWSQDLLIKWTNKTLDLLLIRCASKWSL